jgi:putative endonuclease
VARLPTTTEKGRAGEARAVELLRARGYRVVERNVRCGRFEIDVIAYDGDMLCFVEVRRRRQLGAALFSVDVRKQRRVAQAALVYLQRFADQRPLPRCRFDVVVLTGSDAQLVQNAFEATR